MDKYWIENSMNDLMKQIPDHLSHKIDLEPDDNFYKKLLKQSLYMEVANEICQSIGIRAIINIKIVGDSDIKTLDLDSGKQFNEKEIDAAADIKSTTIISMEIRVGIHQTSRPKKLAKIFAHEITHHLMSVFQIKPKEQYENEMLTDLTAICIGLGKLILNGAYDENEIKQHNPIEISNEGIPYLGYPLLSYAYYLHQKKKGVSRSDLFKNLFGPCVDYLKSFGFHSKWGNSFRGKVVRFLFYAGLQDIPDCDGKNLYEEYLKKDPRNNNIIKCISCGTFLRVPKTDKTLQVTCKKCKKKFILKPSY